MDYHILAPTDIAPEVWDEIAPPHARSPMVLHDWTMSTLQAPSQNGAVRVVVSGDPARPDALVPLLVENGPLERHEFIGNTDGGIDVPARDDTALEALARGLVSLPGAVNLLYYPAASRLFDHVAVAARGKALVLRKPQPTPSAPWLELDASWVEPERHIKKKMAQSIRRRERRLNEAGQVRVEFLEPAAHEVEALLDAVIHVEAQSWKQRAGTALLSHEAQRDFLRTYAAKIAHHGRLHITFVYLDDEPIAMSIGEIYNNGYWGHKTGFDERYSRFGPGILLQLYLIRHLAARGVERLDFGGQLDPFKRAWTENAVPTVTLRIYPYTLKGMAALGLDAAQQARRRALGLARGLLASLTSTRGPAQKSAPAAPAG
ncbi:MAG: GNAT family N-acetyltransferase [Maritimibacter sp.]|nr:GNAT family N-acetyltransferase [Maritimibacter sp.]